MKVLFLGFALTLSLGLFASDVSKFNDVLVKGVQKDLKDQNEDSFKSNKPMRAPASVESHPADLPQDEKKQNKSNVKQLGPTNW